MCVSIVARPDWSTVGRTPMLVTDGCTTPSIVDGRRIDAVRRQQLVVGAEVGRRKADGPAALVAPDDGAVDEVVVAEQRARLVHAPLADQPPDPRAADDEVLVADRIDLLGVEAVAAAERAQQREVAGAVVAEQKIGADPDLGDVQPVDEHGAHERFRIPPRQLAA